MKRIRTSAIACLFRRRRSTLAACIAMSMLVACQGADLAPPSGGNAGVSLTLTFPATLSAAAGPLNAYRKTDRVLLRVLDASRTRAQSEASFVSSGDEAHVAIAVQLRSFTEPVEVEVELRRGEDAVFRAHANARLTTGRTTAVEAMLVPVPADVRGPTGLQLTAYGDSLQLEGAVLFATGDTIDQNVAWSSLDPAIASIDSTGLLVAHADGAARIRIRSGEYTDTVMAEVHAQVQTIIVSPANAVIPLDSTRRFSAVLLDRRGNTIPGRTVTWTSSAPTIIAIDAGGLARALAVGSARIAAAASTASVDVAASSVPVGPRIRDVFATVDGLEATLLAHVFPNGAPTQAWFEWSAPGVSSPPLLTTFETLGAGQDAVPITTVLHNLRANTRYVVRAAATNAWGAAISDSITFTTAGLPPQAITVGASAISLSSAMLLGSVNANGSPAEVWFEWGQSPSLASFSETDVQTVSGFDSVPVSVIIGLDGSPQTVYFRILARNAAGSAAGRILSFTTTPVVPVLPIVSTDSASGVGQQMATLHGTVTTGNAAATAWFEWGTSATLSTFSSTPSQTLGPGQSPIPFTDMITGLPVEVPIWIRAAASNAAGTVRGSIRRIR